ncbi:MAG: T9SS type A sorting domain-containing protein [Saprospiraceae bacterium]
MYPNPAHGTLQVELITGEPCLLRMVDQQGRISVEQQNYRSHEIVDISRLTPGYYVVQAIRPNGDVHVGKVTIR